MFKLSVPTLSLVIGEGGSGGALAIGCSNVVLMQEFTIYSVISPESCASILWSDSSLAERASEKLKMSPNELIKLGVVDSIVKEPKGGAHRDFVEAAQLIREALFKHFEPLVTRFYSGAKSAATQEPHSASTQPVAAAAKSKGKNAKASLKAVKTTKPSSIVSKSLNFKAVGDEMRLSRIQKFRKMGSVALAHAPLNGGN